MKRRLLFDLPILYAGSFGASGLDPKDRADWPAIKDGYDHAG